VAGNAHPTVEHPSTKPSSALSVENSRTREHGLLRTINCFKQRFKRVWGNPRIRVEEQQVGRSPFKRELRPPITTSTEPRIVFTLKDRNTGV
jgi:hypothetical protein